MDTFVFATPIGGLLLVADDEALIRLDFMDHEHECPAGLPADVGYTNMLSQGDQIENTVIKQAVAELAAYFTKDLKTFSVPIKLNYCGTAFQQKCWQALTQIPYGETRSYKDIAKAIDSPNACRAVGGANHRNPIAIIVPCHRVVGANQKMVGYGGGMWRKVWLLDLERRKLALF